VFKDTSLDEIHTWDTDIEGMTGDELIDIIDGKKM